MSTTSPAPDTERESLSALFDGELQADAARFAWRRFEHDPQWREACGRWQLAGDVLRGQAMAPAPAGFSERVAAALRADAAAEVPLAAAAGVGRQAPRRWIGGAALAASVAVVALFANRPLTDGAVPSALQAPAQLAAGTAAGSTPPAALDAPGLVPVPAGSATAPTAMVASAVAPQSAIPASSPRQSLEATAVQPPPLLAAGPVPAPPAANVPAAAPAASLAADPDALAGAHPFRPTGEIITRPWPRAPLGGLRTGSAFQVGFQGPREPARGFYPFEPRLEAEPRFPPPAEQQP